MDMVAAWRESVTWALKVNFIILGFDAIFLAIWLMLQNISLAPAMRKDFFAVLLLLESGLVFLTGGTVAMVSSIFASKVREYFFGSKEKWSAEKCKKSEARASLYILVAVFLFCESLGLALFL